MAPPSGKRGSVEISCEAHRDVEGKKSAGGWFIDAPLNVYILPALSDKDRDNRVQKSRPGSSTYPHTDEGHSKDPSINFFGDSVDQMLNLFWGDCTMKGEAVLRDLKPAL